MTTQRELTGTGHEVRRAHGGSPFVQEPDEKLLDAAWRADVPLASSCGGQGVCGSCVIRVVASEAPLPEPDEVEARWARETFPEPGVRLACRMSLSGPATIDTTYW